VHKRDSQILHPRRWRGGDRGVSDWAGALRGSARTAAPGPGARRGVHGERMGVVVRYSAEPRRALDLDQCTIMKIEGPSLREPTGRRCSRLPLTEPAARFLHWSSILLPPALRPCDRGVRGIGRRPPLVPGPVPDPHSADRSSPGPLLL